MLLRETNLFKMSDTIKTRKKYSVLFKKFLNNACTKGETDDILNFIEDPANDKLLRQEANSQFLLIGSTSSDELMKAEIRSAMDSILDKLHHEIRLKEEAKSTVLLRKNKLFTFFARAAAILLLPLLIYAAYLTFKTSAISHSASAEVSWQTIKTPAGTQIKCILPDGSQVWLNSGSVLEYPLPFAHDIRQVKLTGEAFFDVKKDPLHPFIVNAGKLNVEVKGTRFNICNYLNEPQSELILESGSVCVFDGSYADKKTIAYIKPGERALLDNTRNKLSVSDVDVEKHTSWKQGLMIFRDDQMDEVVRQLNRKFNVDIILQDPELKDYIYTATFQDESLTQILRLLKISAPVSYVIYPPKQMTDNSFSKQKIIITKRK
jgi:transmembrane sensor